MVTVLYYAMTGHIYPLFCSNALFLSKCNLFQGTTVRDSSTNEEEYSANPQTLLFSATVPSWVHSTAWKYMKPNPRKYDLVGTQSVKTAKNVKVRFVVLCLLLAETIIVPKKPIMLCFGIKLSRDIYPADLLKPPTEF